MKIFSYSLMLIMPLMVSCGKTNSQKNSIQVKSNPYAEQQVTYLAVLQPLNKEMAGTVSGSLTVAKDGDFLIADVRVSGSAPNIIHAQNIHFGQLCPNEAADANLDGVVDIIEADAYVGSIIIPLDGDLNSQYASQGIYPVSDPWGTYIYSEIASYTRIQEDLYSPDENDFDNLLKLPEAQHLDLDGRVVIIQGIADDAELPSTVESTGILSGNQTLPIACGILERVTRVPGAFEPDDITIGTVPTTTTPGSRRPGIEPPRNERSRPNPNSPSGPINAPGSLHPSRNRECPPNDKTCR